MTLCFSTSRVTLEKALRLPEPHASSVNGRTGWHQGGPRTRGHAWRTGREIAPRPCRCRSVVVLLMWLFKQLLMVTQRPGALDSDRTVFKSQLGRLPIA